ncbi:MAG: glycosyltransferase [Pseudomonadota bacterium]|nr:glycosyltransferase [Pseudomonadota bacterium]
MPPSITIIGLIHREETRAFGGAPLVMANLASHFARRGLAVEVLVFTRPGIREFPFHFDERVRLRLLRAQSRLGLFVQIARALLHSRPDAMIAGGTKANLLAAHATRLPGVTGRLWVMLHHNLSSEMAGWSQRKRARRVRLWRSILPRAAGLITVSEGVADDFVAQTGVSRDKVNVIYNPIVDPVFEERMCEPADHPWFRDAGPPVILGVGRLTAQKDFATLVAAFALVRQRRPCRLLIIGEGEEQERLGQLAAMLGVGELVDLAGFKPNPLPYMRAARLLVMSSRWEGFGNVLVEALYCGTPVVSTDCPHGPREVLADGRYGRLVSVGDPEALAAGIEEALDEEPDSRRLRARAEEFSVASIGDRYLDLLGLPRP